ncbi:hypothetical protein EON83_00075 [bacterium]|nr:MAG: hypothetical protein EON83_00075 [bacterium]
MPFPNIERVKGRRVTVTCNGVKTQWDKITVRANFEVENPQSAHARYKEKVLDITDGQATISGFLGKSNNTQNLPMPGDLITDLSFAVAENEIIPPRLKAALTAGDWRVIDISIESGKDSAKWSITIEPGFIDADEDELEEA